MVERLVALRLPFDHRSKLTSRGAAWLLLTIEGTLFSGGEKGNAQGMRQKCVCGSPHWYELLETLGQLDLVCHEVVPLSIYSQKSGCNELPVFLFLPAGWFAEVSFHVGMHQRIGQR